MARRMLIAEVRGGRVRSRPKLGWIDGEKMAVSSRDMTVDYAQCAKDVMEWRAFVHMLIIELHAAIFVWFLGSFGPLSRSMVAYIIWRGVGCRYMMRVGINSKKYAKTDIKE